MAYCMFDLATAPRGGTAAEWLATKEYAPAANLKDPEKIEASKAEKKRKAEDAAGLDPDLSRITAFGYWFELESTPTVRLCKTEDDERAELLWLADFLRPGPANTQNVLVTFNGFEFDLARVNARSRYLGIPLRLELAPWRSPHIDLGYELSDQGKGTMRKLVDYAALYGVLQGAQKPLAGAEEARVLETGRWDELHASLVHDLTLTLRLWDRIKDVPR